MQRAWSGFLTDVLGSVCSMFSEPLLVTIVVALFLSNAMDDNALIVDGQAFGKEEAFVLVTPADLLVRPPNWEAMPELNGVTVAQPHGLSAGYHLLHDIRHVGEFRITESEGVLVQGDHHDDSTSVEFEQDVDRPIVEVVVREFHHEFTLLSRSDDRPRGHADVAGCASHGDRSDQQDDDGKNEHHALHCGPP